MCTAGQSLTSSADSPRQPGDSFTSSSRFRVSLLWFASLTAPSPRRLFFFFFFFLGLVRGFADTYIRRQHTATTPPRANQAKQQNQTRGGGQTVQAVPKRGFYVVRFTSSGRGPLAAAAGPSLRTHLQKPESRCSPRGGGGGLFPLLPLVIDHD
ncbi:hypothetical protein LX36DRAFT_398503 [Colletotrichum falcatum]|nr:hypothetical protein LX36DRAFT_398503 [Colletotrichum falcatum]